MCVWFFLGSYDEESPRSSAESLQTGEECAKDDSFPSPNVENGRIYSNHQELCGRFGPWLRFGLAICHGLIPTIDLS